MTRITASYAGNAGVQSSSGSTVFGSAFLIERQETALREGCAQAQGGGAELTPTGVNATLNVVVPGTVTVTIIVRAAAARFRSACRASSRRRRELPTGNRRSGMQRRRSLVQRLWHAPGEPTAAASRCRGGRRETQEAQAKLPLIASLTRHLTRGGKTKLLIPYTAHGSKVERAFIKQLRAYKHHHTRGAKKPRLKLKLTLGYKPG